jgi:RND family efflux transporter MFP subunit
MTASWRTNGMWTVAVSVLGLALAYFLLVGKPSPEPQPPAKISPPTVNVVVVNPRLRAIPVETQGTVRPLREINLVTQVAGRVELVSAEFAEGAFFLADKELLRLEGTDYQFAISRAQAQVAAARQKVAEEKGRALQASREWRDLGSDQGNDLFLRKPQLVSAQAALDAAKADLGAARLDLERTSLKVPFNGRISEKYVGLGQFVTPGTAVAKVYDTDVALVRLPLTDRQVALLDLPLSYDDGTVPSAPDATVVLQARFANRSWQWQGRIVRTDANIDVNSRVVYAVAEVQRPFARDPGSDRPPLSPGLFVNAIIGGKSLAGVAVLPRSALRSDATVMLVDAQQRAKVQAVEVLHSQSEHAWVQGLNSGDRVIVDVNTVAVAGMEVSPNNVTSLAGAGN